MLKQFEINPYVGKQIQSYLENSGLSLKEAMDEENHNREIAALIHAGLPTMVQKIYGLNKMQTFFWEKKDLLHGFIADRLAGHAAKAKK